jgi:hypothetical protein
MLKSLVLPFLKSYAPNAIRHAAQAAAGGLMTAGVINADQSVAVTGALLTLLTMTWSYIEKKDLLNKVFAA